MNKKILLNLSLVIGIITSIYFIAGIYLEVLPEIIPDLLEELAGFPFTAFILSVAGIILALLGIKTNFKKAIICLVLNLITFVLFVFLLMAFSGGFGF